MAGTNALIDGGLPELSYALDTCARCGFCKTVCPTHPFGGGFEPWSPRAKVHYLKELREGREELTPEWVDCIYQCTSCERCAEVCQTDIPLVHVWEAARAAAVKAGFGPMPAHKKLRVLVEQHQNPYGEPPAERGRWMLEHHRPAEKADLLVFGGCTASYRMPPMLQTGVSILQRQGIPYAYAAGEEVCCGSPFLRTGQQEVAGRLMGRNINLFHQLGVKSIVSPCGGCSKTLRHDYPRFARESGRTWDFEVLHFSQVYARLLAGGSSGRASRWRRWSPTTTPATSAARRGSTTSRGPSSGASPASGWWRWTTPGSPRAAAAPAAASRPTTRRWRPPSPGTGCRRRSPPGPRCSSPCAPSARPASPRR